METYILKSTAILGILWLGYILFLEHENMHRFKRFYLLSALFAAICIPLITFTEVVYIGQLDNTVFFQNEIIPFGTLQDFEIIEAPFWTLKTILWSIYSIGVLIFGIRFIRNLFRIIKTIKQNEKLEQKQITFVLLKQLINPHTFFNYIFLNKQKFKNNDLPKEVLLHEETHAKQKHSLDVFFIELLQVLFWFQPFIWFYKKHIKLNHEFLADQAVLNQGFESANYQKTLLSFSSNHQDYSFVNAINYSSIKKRFTVMKTQTPKTKKWFLGLLILPVLAILTYSFSEREIIKKEVYDQENFDQNRENTIHNIKSELEKANDLQIIYVDEASEELMKEYKSFIKKYNETNIIYVDAYERAIIIYDQLMSDTQRASVEKYPQPFVQMPNISKTKAQKPTKAQFEAFKNEKEYAIWIDKKHVSNSELDNYNYDDFVHFTGSIVHKNARSKKFPQPNQYNLYTKAGFKDAYQNAQLINYNKVSKTYSNAISKYLKGAQTDNSELKILKAKADAIYKTFSNEEIKENNIKSTSAIPDKDSQNITNKKQSNNPKTGFININEELHFYVVKQNKKHYYNKNGFETDESGNVISKKQVNASDVIDNQYITKAYKNDKIVVEFADNLNQKEKGENWNKIKNTFQQNPPTAKEISEYNTWAISFNKKAEKLSKKEKIENYPIMTNDVEFRKYKSIYKRMTPKQLNVVEPWPKAVLRMPPPPPPPAPIKDESVVFVNGKKLNSLKISMTSNEFRNLKLSLTKGAIKSFSLKMAGINTQSIRGNSINEQSIILFNNTLNKDATIFIMNIKTSNNLKIKPFEINITDLD